MGLPRYQPHSFSMFQLIDCFSPVKVVDEDHSPICWDTNDCLKPPTRLVGAMSTCTWVVNPWFLFVKPTYGFVYEFDRSKNTMI